MGFLSITLHRSIVYFPLTLVLNQVMIGKEDCWETDCLRKQTHKQSIQLGSSWLSVRWELLVMT